MRSLRVPPPGCRLQVGRSVADRNREMSADHNLTVGEWRLRRAGGPLTGRA